MSTKITALPCTVTTPPTLSTVSCTPSPSVSNTQATRSGVNPRQGLGPTPSTSRPWPVGPRARRRTQPAAETARVVNSVSRPAPVAAERSSLLGAGADHLRRSLSLPCCSRCSCSFPCRLRCAAPLSPAPAPNIGCRRRNPSSRRLSRRGRLHGLRLPRHRLQRAPGTLRAGVYIRATPGRRPRSDAHPGRRRCRQDGLFSMLKSTSRRHATARPRRTVETSASRVGDRSTEVIHTPRPRELPVYPSVPAAMRARRSDFRSAEHVDARSSAPSRRCRRSAVRGETTFDADPERRGRRPVRGRPGDVVPEVVTARVVAGPRSRTGRRRRIVRGWRSALSRRPRPAREHQVAARTMPMTTHRRSRPCPAHRLRGVEQGGPAAWAVEPSGQGRTR